MATIGLQLDRARNAVPAAKPRISVTQVLLACGILSSLFYISGDVLGATLFEGYSYVSQTISELTAIGAPTRWLLVPFYIVYDLLFIAFGFGLLQAAARNRALRVTGGLVVAFGIVGLTAPFAPMHMRGAETSLTDTMHIVLASVDVLFILLTIAFGASAFGKRFRKASAATFGLVLVFGFLTGVQGPDIAANQPTPWVGITERIAVYAYMLWVIALAFLVLRAQLEARPVAARRQNF